MPEVLKYLDEQQARAQEIEALLQVIDDHDDAPAALAGMALRIARELNQALDSVALLDVLKEVRS